MTNVEISEKYFQEFKELTKKKIGEEAYNKMTEQELLETAMKLITLVRTIYQPIKKENIDK